jgi:maleate cis-trans isomerase
MANWKARIGYLSPSVFEVPSDWTRILPAGFSLVTTGLNVRAHTTAEFEKAINDLEAALSVFVAEEVDVILLAGITLATQRGYRAEGEIIESLSEKLKRPVTSAMRANAEALKYMKAKKILIATAYLEKINQALKRYFEDAGFQVLAIRGLDVSKPLDQAKLPDDASYQVARGLADDFPYADAVLIHGRWSSLGCVERLEREISRPVVSSVAAALWHMLELLKIDLNLEGCGRILRGDVVTARPS